MDRTSSYRRPMLAAIAASAILLGGASLSKICLQNPKLLYAVGQARLVLGDRDGGLRLIAMAAQENEQNPAQPQAAERTLTPVRCTASARPSPKTIVKATPAEGHKQWIAMRAPRVLTQDRFEQVAKLEPAALTQVFDRVAFDKEMKRVRLEQAAETQQQVHDALTRVRAELDRRGIPVPPSFPASAPVTPSAPVTQP